MGRDRGYLALMSVVAGGAEVAVVPEVEIRTEALLLHLERPASRASPTS